MKVKTIKTQCSKTGLTYKTTFVIKETGVKYNSTLNLHDHVLVIQGLGTCNHQLDQEQMEKIHKEFINDQEDSCYLQKTIKNFKKENSSINFSVIE